MQLERLSVKDREEYTAFLIEAYKDQFNSRRFSDSGFANRSWQWEYLDNPSAVKDLPDIWLARVDGKIAGQFCLMPVTLKSGDKTLRGGWCQNFIVLPQYRKMGIGRALVSHVMAERKEHMDALLVAGTNDTSYAIFKNLGITDAGHIPLYVRINRLGFLNFPAQLRKYFRPSGKDIRIEEITSFDGSFDRLWESASAGLALAVRRDSAYLNWRFIAQPYWKYRIFKALRKDSHDTVGYIVLREGKSRGLPTGVISDVFAPANNPDIIMALIDFAVSFFEKNGGIDIIRCDLLNRSAGNALRRCGFLSIPSRTRLMFTGIEPGRRDNWFFDYSDSDLDIFG